MHLFNQCVKGTIKVKQMCFGRILKTVCRKLKMPEDFDYGKLARLTPGYVGADLMALCREAAMNAVNRVLLVGKVPEKSKTSILSSDLPLGTEAVTNDSSENTGTASSPRNTTSEIVDANQLSQDNLGHEHLPVRASQASHLYTGHYQLPEECC